MASKEESEALSSYWQQQVEAWRATGQSQKGFCKAHDLNYHQFGYWIRKFRNQVEQDQYQKSSGFVPVTMNTHHEIDGLSLTLPNGMRVQGIVDDNLATVYQLLVHLS